MYSFLFCSQKKVVKPGVSLTTEVIVADVDADAAARDAYQKKV
jgi:hypothetical protein